MTGVVNDLVVGSMTRVVVASQVAVQACGHEMSLHIPAKLISAVFYIFVDDIFLEAMGYVHYYSHSKPRDRVPRQLIK